MVYLQMIYCIQIYHDMFEGVDRLRRVVASVCLCRLDRYGTCPFVHCALQNESRVILFGGSCTSPLSGENTLGGL